MLLPHKNLDQCHQELRDIKSYVRDMFNAEFSLESIHTQVNHLIRMKVENYIHQRVRDWSVADLVLLREAIVECLAIDAKEKLIRERSASKSYQKLENALGETIGFQASTPCTEASSCNTGEIDKSGIPKQNQAPKTLWEVFDDKGQDKPDNADSMPKVRRRRSKEGRSA